MALFQRPLSSFSFISNSNFYIVCFSLSFICNNKDFYWFQQRREIEKEKYTRMESRSSEATVLFSISVFYRIFFLFFAWTAKRKQNRNTTWLQKKWKKVIFAVSLCFVLFYYFFFFISFLFLAGLRDWNFLIFFF